MATYHIDQIDQKILSFLVKNARMPFLEIARECGVSRYPEVIAHLKKIPEIVECHFVTGRYAILAKVYCLDNDHLMEVLLNTIQKIPYIQSTDTMISLDEPIERQVWVKDFKSTTYTGLNKKAEE